MSEVTGPFGLVSGTPLTLNVPTDKPGFQAVVIQNISPFFLTVQLSTKSWAIPPSMEQALKLPLNVQQLVITPSTLSGIVPAGVNTNLAAVWYDTSDDVSTLQFNHPVPIITYAVSVGLPVDGAGNLNVDVQRVSGQPWPIDVSNNPKIAIASPLDASLNVKAALPETTDAQGSLEVWEWDNITPITASAIQTHAVNTVTLPGAVGKTTFITGFTVSAPAGAPLVTVTVTGVVSGTLNYLFSDGIIAMTIPLTQPIPASAVNTSISVSCPDLGVGIQSAVTAYGFQR